MCRCAVRSSGEPMRWARSHSPSGGSITYPERGGQEVDVGAQRGDGRIDRVVDAGAHLEALGVAAHELARVVETLVALDVPALALDALVADPQVGVVGGILGPGVDHGLQLVEPEVGEVGERRDVSAAQDRELVLDAVPEAHARSLGNPHRARNAMRPVAGSASTSSTRTTSPARGTPVQRASTGGSATNSSPGSFSGPDARSTTASNSAP